MPSTTRGAAIGVSRTVPVWQTRAVESDLIDAEPPAPRDADRQVVPGSKMKPTRRVAARQLVAADRRQRLEDPYGGSTPPTGAQQRSARLAADRPYLKCSVMSS